MLSQRQNPVRMLLLLLFLASLACQVPAAGISTPTVQATTPPVFPSIAPRDTPHPGATTPSPPAPTAPRPTSLPALVEHRIAIHSIYGLAEFYDRESTSHFIPRGVDYALLVPVLDHYEDRLFATGLYDHNRIQADFAALSAGGFNTVRILLDGCTSGDTCIGLPGGQGLNPSYLDNIADLLSLAKANHLFVLFASQGLPELGGYASLADQGADPFIAPGRNATLLTPEGLHASQQYWSDLLIGLASRQAAVDAVLGWELLAEQYYDANQLPFSMQSGRVTLAGGQDYDMARPSQRQALAVDGLQAYMRQVRQVILSIDPTALVTMGFLAPDSPTPWREGDSRYAVTAALLQESSLDFYDLHASPGMGLTATQLAENFGMGGHISKPVIMGDVGASTWAYPQVSAAAVALQDWVAASCEQGFSGWIFSAYYPIPAGSMDATWSLVDDHNTLLNALSPKSQPDACAISVLPGRNLAQGKPVQVSAALPDQAAEMAVDGDPSTQWSAGEFPTQWIEVDLGAAYTLGEIRLTVGQWPDGQTIHQLWVGASRGGMQMVQEFSGYTYDFDVLDYLPASPLRDIRFIRLVTTESPSWVSWREIEVLAPFPATPTPLPTASPTPAGELISTPPI